MSAALAAERRARDVSLTAPFGVSVLLHFGVAAALILAPHAKRAARPPMYRVNLVAAPAGVPAEGVSAPPAPPTPVAPPARSRVVPPPTGMPLPRRNVSPKKAAPAVAPTPAPPASAPPPAANASTGARGADVATVRTEGIEFPYPGYLENIVRAIAVRFRPPPNTVARAEVLFLIRRDGSVVPNSLQFVTPSGNFAFDLEAQGAIEDAGAKKAFGPLPTGFSDDVLPVVFSFDPRVLH